MKLTPLERMRMDVTLGRDGWGWRKGGSVDLAKRLDEEIVSNEGRLQAAVADADYGRAAGLNGVLAGLRLARRLAAVRSK